MADFEKVEGSKSDHDLKLYAISTCGWCKKTRNFLESNDVAYEYVYVDLLKGQDQTDAVEQVSKLNPDRTFPTLVIDGDEVLIGFKEDAFKEKIL
jgi:glutaredoxin-like protein NrdH